MTMTARTLGTAGFTLLACAFALSTYPHGDSDDEDCKTSDLKGPYGFSAQGSVQGLSYAEVGREESDGKGKVSGRATQSFDGVIQTVGFSGTYTVNSDCTGTATLAVDPGASLSSFMGSTSTTGTRAFVIVDRGKQFHYMFTTPGTVVAGSGAKIKVKDDNHDDDDHHHD
jgi:hypothetical protein